MTDAFTTEADVRFFDANLWSAYSECFKSEHGFRPRVTPSPAEMESYLKGYDERLPQLQKQWAEEAEWLDEQDRLYEVDREAARLQAIEDAANGVEWDFLDIENLASIRGHVPTSRLGHVHVVR